MSDDQSLVLSLPLIQPAQAQKHVTHNEALRLLDVLVQPAVASRTATVPPDPAQAGQRFVVAPGAVGAWAGQDGAIAVFEPGGWVFLAPQPGWQVHVLDEAATAAFDGTLWTTPAEHPQRFPRLGIGTAADAVNRLAVAAPATLLGHAGAGHQLKIVKATPADTASLLFQTAWSGRAEMGLAGSDAFAIKVSPDGTAWTTALSFNPASGLAGGQAVTQSAADGTAGRLVRVGDFGLGGIAPLIGAAGATDAGIVPGTYAYDATLGSTGGPAAVQRGLLLHRRRASGGGEAQILVVESATGSLPAPGTLFSRSRVTGAWTAWTPAGIADGGANANGRYLRHADGTQLCWQLVTTSATAEVAASFPAAFASAVDLRTTLGVNASAAIALSARFTARTVSGLSLSVFNTANARVATAVEVVTVGRWVA